MSKIVYITTAIDYVNAKPHIGHAVEKVEADVLARWNRDIKENDVYFLSGVDENSLKNVQAAKKQGKSVEQFVDENSKHYEHLKDILNLSYDQFFRTTQEKHFKGARKLWEAFKPEDVYKKNYRGLYCVGCEEFKTEKDLVDGKCPDHNEVPQQIEEENYFFKLSNYQDELLKLIESDAIKIRPEYRKNEVISFIKGGLEDFSISRSKERAENWGVPVPGDDSQIMYVWVDALSSYITALDYADEGELYQKYWVNADERIHVIGKGISRFHTIYWPAMLLSAGVPLPTEILIHEYLTIDGKKISKTLGNVISPEDIVSKYGTDATRYLLLSALPYTKDGDISWDKMAARYSADLANDLGNLVQRTLSMINRYEIKISHREDYFEVNEEPEENAIFQSKVQLGLSLPELKLDHALSEIWRVVSYCNVYIEQKKPWELAKNKEEAELTRVLNVVYWTIKDIASWLAPFMPETSEKILKQLEEIKPEVIFPRGEN